MNFIKIYIKNNFYKEVLSEFTKALSSSDCELFIREIIGYETIFEPKDVKLTHEDMYKYYKYIQANIMFENNNLLNNFPVEFKFDISEKDIPDRFILLADLYKFLDTVKTINKNLESFTNN